MSFFFCFNRQFYEQTIGVAIGSPLSPVSAIFFMEGLQETHAKGLRTNLSAGSDVSTP